MLNPFTLTHPIFKSSGLEINSFRICLELKQQPIQVEFISFIKLPHHVTDFCDNFNFHKIERKC